MLALAVLTEALAVTSCYVARRGAAGTGRDGERGAPASSATHAARMGTAYLVMLAVMSFNGGVLLATVAGHALGFLLVRSRVHPGGGATAPYGSKA
ncbi:copper transporter 6-like [Setaria viridis]|uniref:copper transporter 6-like n=1 Tax=Setaria viridis TaxID=4556 RepID=UPI003B3BA75A